MKHITPTDLAAWLADASRPAPLLLDVRNDNEFAHCRIEGSVQIPMPLIPARAQELPEDAPIVVICHHGSRSFQVAHYLETHGYGEAYNLSGGVEAWALTVDPTMPRY